VAAALGESPARTQSALTGVVPAVLGGMVNTVTTPAQAEMLLGIIRRHRFDDGPPNGSGVAMTPEGVSGLIANGRPLLESLLRGRTSAVGDWVTGLSGIGKSSSLSLMSLVLPLLLGQIGRRVTDMGWSASSLLGLLAEQRSFLQSAPAGLQALFGHLDDRREPAVIFERVPVVRDDDETQESEAMVAAVSRRRSALMWALPLLLLIPIVLYFVTRGESGRGSVVRNASAPDVPSPVATAGIAALGPFVERELPDNTTLRIPTNGVESKLIGFIEDATKVPSSETWFTFDRLEFETDSARLTSSAAEQLRNVADILRAYPAVKVKIGGYTDNTADASHNLQLSQARASAAMQQIVAMGVDATRVAAEGYGEQHPVADNSTPEGRQRNRRVDIRVTDK
jgi:outer membrane protein OmpA-like peptidoglycan-associated protein